MQMITVPKGALGFFRAEIAVLETETIEKWMELLQLDQIAAAHERLEGITPVTRPPPVSDLCNVQEMAKQSLPRSASAEPTGQTAPNTTTTGQLDAELPVLSRDALNDGRSHLKEITFMLRIVRRYIGLIGYVNASAAPAQVFRHVLAFPSAYTIGLSRTTVVVHLQERLFYLLDKSTKLSLPCLNENYYQLLQRFHQLFHCKYLLTATKKIKILPTGVFERDVTVQKPAESTPSTETSNYVPVPLPSSLPPPGQARALQVIAVPVMPQPTQQPPTAPSPASTTVSQLIVPSTSRSPSRTAISNPLDAIRSQTHAVEVTQPYSSTFPGMAQWLATRPQPPPQQMSPNAVTTEQSPPKTETLLLQQQVSQSAPDIQPQPTAQPSPPQPQALEVLVVQATDLFHYGTTCNPFVNVIGPDGLSISQTPTCEGTYSPFWNGVKADSPVNIRFADKAQVLKFYMINAQATGNLFLGEVSISFGEILAQPYHFEGTLFTLPLQPRVGEPDRTIAESRGKLGQLTFRIKHVHSIVRTAPLQTISVSVPQPPAPPSQPQQQQILPQPTSVSKSFPWDSVPAQQPTSVAPQQLQPPQPQTAPVTEWKVGQPWPGVAPQKSAAPLQAEPQSQPLPIQQAVAQPQSQPQPQTAPVNEWRVGQSWPAAEPQKPEPVVQQAAVQPQVQQAHAVPSFQPHLQLQAQQVAQQPQPFVQPQHTAPVTQAQPQPQVQQYTQPPIVAPVASNPPQPSVPAVNPHVEIKPQESVPQLTGPTGYPIAKPSSFLVTGVASYTPPEMPRPTATVPPPTTSTQYQPPVVPLSDSFLPKQSTTQAQVLDQTKEQQKPVGVAVPITMLGLLNQSTSVQQKNPESESPERETKTSSSQERTEQKPEESAAPPKVQQLPFNSVLAQQNPSTSAPAMPSPAVPTAQKESIPQPSIPKEQPSSQPPLFTSSPQQPAENAAPSPKKTDFSDVKMPSNTSAELTSLSSLQPPSHTNTNVATGSPFQVTPEQLGFTAKAQTTSIPSPVKAIAETEKTGMSSLGMRYLSNDLNAGMNPEPIASPTTSSISKREFSDWGNIGTQATFAEVTNVIPMVVSGATSLHAAYEKRRQLATQLRKLTLADTVAFSSKAKEPLRAMVFCQRGDVDDVVAHLRDNFPLPHLIAGLVSPLPAISINIFSMFNSQQTSTLHARSLNVIVTCPEIKFSMRKDFVDLVLISDFPNTLAELEAEVANAAGEGGKCVMLYNTKIGENIGAKTLSEWTARRGWPPIEG